MDDDRLTTKNTYVFRSNKELLISTDGNVEKGGWDYLGNNSILIETPSGDFLFKFAYLDDILLILKIDGRAEYAFFVNETKYGKDNNGNCPDCYNYSEKRIISNW